MLSLSIGSVILYLLVAVTSAVVGAILAVVLLLLLAPFFKERFLHKPNDPSSFQFFVQVEDGQAVVIDRGGNYYYTIQGGAEHGPVHSNALLGLWMLYKLYIWNTIQVHVFVPYFTTPKTYDLPRYKVRENNGRREYYVINEGSPGYRTNHVRTAPFTWYFEFGGAEIQTIPYMIKGSAQVRILPNKTREALYLTEAWNVLLDQALNSVSRSVVRGDVTVDMVIGKTTKDIWEEPETPDEELANRVAKLIFQRVREYQFDIGDAEELGDDPDEFAGLKLRDFGIVIYRIDINDFEDELAADERTQIRAAFLGRQEGRRRDLVGQGIASEQRHLLEVHNEGGEASPRILEARAFVDAAKEGKVDAFLASLIKKLKE